jgi:hypothetical protein
VPDPGFPDLAAIPTLGPDLRISDLIIQLDPPQVRQPAGTSVVAEIRGTDSIPSGDVSTATVVGVPVGNPPNGTDLYNPVFAGGTGFAPSDSFNGRGQLLNPNYACEAYRYSRGRVAAVGLTRYVTEDQFNLIRSPAGLLPRFLNLRIQMTNNIAVSPVVSPSLRSVTLAYRVRTP